MEDKLNDLHTKQKTLETVIGISYLFAVIGLVVGGYLAWSFAPPVGGEWWPYIRVTVSIISGLLVARVLSGIAASIAFMVLD